MRSSLRWWIGFATLLVISCGDDNEGGTEHGPLIGPAVTYLGVARADDTPLAPSSFDALGRPVYSRPLGQGLSLVVEARPGPSGAPVGIEAFAQDELPDLQILVSRPLGNGSSAVCDAGPEIFGGVPGIDPPVFNPSRAVIHAVNDLGCRTNDGTGRPIARTASSEACTLSDSTGGFGFGFVAPATTVQFCIPIARAWAFPAGDTIVAARVRDQMGFVGPVAEMVLRVGQ